MTIEEIVIKAIPLSSCPQKRDNELYRREVLRKRIEELLKEERSNQPFNPVKEYK